MIRGIGVLVISTYSQTLNVQECFPYPIYGRIATTRIEAPSGPSSVSGAGDAEWTAKEYVVSKLTGSFSIREKGVGGYRQLDGGHGSRHPPRSV